MKCPHCNKFLTERLVATKTKKVDGNVIVLDSRRALVCDTHGVAAWDPPTQGPTYVPYIPYVPALPQPYRPWPMTVQPQTNPFRYPTITYCGGSGTARSQSQLSNGMRALNAGGGAY